MRIYENHTPERYFTFRRVSRDGEYGKRRVTTCEVCESVCGVLNSLKSQVSHYLCESDFEEEELKRKKTMARRERHTPHGGSDRQHDLRKFN